jgi:hypothetical protein
MNFKTCQTSALLASITIALLATACGKSDTSDGDPAPAASTSQDSTNARDPGPVEHIDTSERIAATKLIPTQDPVQKDISIFKAEVRGAFDEKKFEFLEKTASELRKSKALFGEGSWKLKIFYDALEERFNHGEEFWQTDIQTYAAWEKSAPSSLTRRIGLINLLTNYAWDARGSGYANDVTEANSQIFHSRLEMAAKVFAETRSLSEKGSLLPARGHEHRPWTRLAKGGV